jgi:glycosyltransferase involved in cell wall biosynthesis
MELTEQFRFIYAGTLTLQHNPNLLLQLGRQLDARGQGELIVISEGDGISWLRMQADKQRVKSIRFLGFQPFNRLAEVLGSADVLVAILEPDAGVFCVPSKVLSYLCAGKPVLAAIPETNLAARLIKNHFLGIAVNPLLEKDFLAAVEQLQNNPEACRQFGRNARAYAEEHFDFDRICQRFLAILEGKRDDTTASDHSSSERSLASTE